MLAMHPGQSREPRIAIVGLDYVGAVTAACLADLGRSIIGWPAMQPTSLISPPPVRQPG